jgi:hypothetical protein
VIVSASPISIMDPTVLDRIRQLRLELAREGFVRVRDRVWDQFNRRWVEGERQVISVLIFATLKTALAAFQERYTLAGETARAA